MVDRCLCARGASDTLVFQSPDRRYPIECVGRGVWRRNVRSRATRAVGKRRLLLEGDAATGSGSDLRFDRCIARGYSAVVVLDTYCRPDFIRGNLVPLYNGRGGFQRQPHMASSL